MIPTGLLSAVSSLSATIQDSIISLNWTAPFTLDIPKVDPDITYCVGVVDSISSSTLHSQCGITETEYEYPIPPDSACHDYMVTVTPVNVVGNGTSSPLTFSETIYCKCFACTCIFSNYLVIGGYGSGFHCPELNNQLLCRLCSVKFSYPNKQQR